MLPLSATALVANGVREALASVLAAPVHLRLFEPSIPTRQAWEAIVHDASLFRIRGSRADATIVVRAHDALALVHAAFGEDGESRSIEGTRALSSIERAVLERVIRAFAGSLAPVCGMRGDAVAAPIEAINTLAGPTTYFELQLDQPKCARIGIALSREPAIGCGEALSVERLLDAELELVVRCEGPAMTAGTLATLEPGAFVPMTLGTGFPATLEAAGWPVARGECGVRRRSYAFAVTTPAFQEGSLAEAS